MLQDNPLYKQLKRLRIRRRLRYFRHRISSGFGKGSLSRTDLIAGFREMGIGSGDTVLLHSSLSRLGLIQGGPTTVVSALLEIIGGNGTLVASTIHLRKDAVAHFSENPVFDVQHTPSSMGAISEAVRNLPQAVRSLHPTHSVTAVGKSAAYLTVDHHRSDRPFGATSPYYRLGELGGKILLLGVPLASMTNFHVIEDIMGDRFPYPVYLPSLVEARVLHQGKEQSVQTRIHNPIMSAERKCNELENILLEKDVIKTGTVGAGKTTVVLAKELNEVLGELVKEEITIYTPNGNPLEMLK